MWLCWLVVVVWATPVEDARALIAAGRIEAAVAVLDPHLGRDAAAGLLRFELADRLEDHEALQAVLTEEVLAGLPWSTRDQAHLLRARREVALGRIEAAKVHLDLVFPNSEAFAASRLLVGDLEAAAGHYRSAVHTWRDAVLGGEEGQGLLRIAEVYERLGRPANAVTYFEMIPAESPVWFASRMPLARDLLAIGAEGEAMAVLIALAEPSGQGERWTPELQFLRAEAWAQRCRHQRADEIRAKAVAALAPILNELWLQLGQGHTPESAWEVHFGHEAHGRLPQAWYRTFLDGEDVSPLMSRLLRIDRELVEVALDGQDTLVAALAARRAMTVRSLGLRLLVALQREHDRLEPWVEGRAAQDGLVVVLPEDEQPERRLAPRKGRRWPFRGEFWPGETRERHFAPSACMPEQPR